MEKLKGQKFDRLTVIKRVNLESPHVWVSVKCECGNQKEVRYNDLRYGATRSCGCLKRQQQRFKSKLKPLSELYGNTKHCTEILHSFAGIRGKEIVVRLEKNYIRLFYSRMPDYYVIIYFDGRIEITDKLDYLDFYKLYSILKKYKPV